MKIKKEQFIEIGEQMFEDGTSFSERYSIGTWNRNGWPEVDDDMAYEVFDAYLKFLHKFKEYEDGERKESRFLKGGIFGRRSKAY